MGVRHPLAHDETWTLAHQCLMRGALGEGLIVRVGRGIYPRLAGGEGSTVRQKRVGRAGRIRLRRRHRRLPAWGRAALSVLLAVAWIPLIAQATSAATSIVVSLNFDNNAASQYYLGFQDALQPAGVDATFYINSGTLWHVQ